MVEYQLQGILLFNDTTIFIFYALQMIVKLY